MKQISYYATVIALSTLLLLSGYEDRNLSRVLGFFSFLVSVVIALIFVCRSSKRPAWHTILKTIGIVYMGPTLCHFVYFCFFIKMINTHVLNILIVLGVILLGQFLSGSPPATKSKRMESL